MKKILVLTSRLPYPVIGGDKLRIYNICKKLKKEGYELELFSFIESDYEKKNIVSEDLFSEIVTVLLPKWKSILSTAFGFFLGGPLQVSYYRSKKMKKLVQNALLKNKYDGVLVHLVRMAPYVKNASKINKVLEMTDAISLNYSRSRKRGAFSFMSLIYRIEEKRVLNYEIECIKKFNAIVLVSNVDRDFLKEKIGSEDQNKLSVFCNGVTDELLSFNQEDYDANKIIFIGNLRSFQNQNAILYFIKDIYPLIKKEIPDVKLIVIGAEPPNSISVFNGVNGIEVTGKVNDIKVYAKDAALSVAPILIGAGIQNKILESMVMGIPVVTTSIGMEGIEGTKSNEHLLVADNTVDFADGVLGILRDKSKRNFISSNGKKLIRDYYAFDKQLAGYSKLFN